MSETKGLRFESSDFLETKSFRFESLRIKSLQKVVYRYDEDPYDRLWEAGRIGNGSIPASSDATFDDLTSLDDRPPLAVLKNAAAATRLNASMELMMGFHSKEIPSYINWYFSEVTPLGAGQNRSFRIFKDGKPFSEPITPPYGGCHQVWASGYVVSNRTVFTLVPTNVSTLPPLVNAVEIFEIGKTELTDGTNRKDGKNLTSSHENVSLVMFLIITSFFSYLLIVDLVKGLASLQEGFSVLRNWSGDPCLPTFYNWDWIQCSDDPVPRVTAL